MKPIEKSNRKRRKALKNLGISKENPERKDSPMTENMRLGQITLVMLRQNTLTDGLRKEDRKNLEENNTNKIPLLIQKNLRR